MSITTPAAVRVWETHFRLYRTIWRSNVMGAFVQPFLYLLGMGLGVGKLVDDGSDAPQLLDGLTYFQFLAPALIATAAMMVTSSESMWPVLGGFKWQSAYHAAAATPLTPGEIASGVGLWHATKALIAGSGVAVALLFFDETRSPGLPLAVLFGGLTGVAFSSVITAWTATREEDRSFPSDQPVRDHAAVPVRRRVLPDLAAARVAAVGREGHAALARGRAHAAAP